MKLLRMGTRRFHTLHRRAAQRDGESSAELWSAECSGSAPSAPSTSARSTSSSASPTNSR